MATSRTLLPPLSLASWMAEQEGCPPALAAARHGQWVEQFENLLADLAVEVCDGWPPDVEAHDAYAGRVWACLEQHWRRLAVAGPLAFDELRRRFDTRDIGIAVGEADLLREVMLAQALEFKQTKAAMMFDTEYMPDVRRVARRYGGMRAEDAVENLAADLILLRESTRYGTLPPRIASYQGRTSLGSWLRAVVMHRTASEGRKKGARPLPEQLSIADGHRAEPTGSRDCEDLLRPVFREAVASLPADDRLLVKMLALDDVPQHALAASLGIHSGSVTRRRQRALRHILSRVSEAAGNSPARTRFQECLHTLLAGDDRSLGQTLGTVLAEALQHDVEPLTEES